MRQLNILVDMDGIVADFLGAYLTAYERETGHTVDRSTLSTFEVCDKLPDQRAAKALMNRLCMTKEFWLNLPLIAVNAQSVIKAWLKRGHTVHFCSTPWRSNSCAAKMEWVEEYFPEVGHKNVVLTHHKQNIQADVLIDDKPTTLINYAARWPKAHLATILYPYHLFGEIPAPVMLAESYKYPERAWMELEQFVTWASEQPL